MGLHEVVGVVARRQLIGERGEGDDQVDGAPDGGTQGALGRPGICGGGEHEFANLDPASDGWAQNTCSPGRNARIWLWSDDPALQRCTRSCTPLARRVAARLARWSTSASS